MTFPAFSVGTPHSSGTGTTSRNVAFGVTLSAGDGLLLVALFRDGTVTAPSSPWAQITGGTVDQNNFFFRAWLLVASGGETSLTLTTQSAVQLIAYPIHIPAASWTSATTPECTTVTALADPPSETASWGSADNGWIVANANNGTGPVTGYPTGFTDDQFNTNRAADTLYTGLATKGDTAATLDPSTFTVGGSPSRNVSATIVVRGSAAGTPATVTPAAIACVAALPAAGLNVGVGPSVVATVSSLPAPGENITAGPAVIAAVVALPTPSAGQSTAVQPASIASTVTLPAGGVSAGAGPTVTACAVAVPQAGVSTGATVSPAPVAVSVSLPRAAIGAGASPAPVALSAALPAASPATSTAVSPAAVTAAAALPGASVTLSATASPAAITAAVTLPQAAGVTEGEAVATPAAISCTAAVPLALPAAQTIVPPAVLAVMAALPALTVLAAATASPAAVDARVAVPQASASGGVPSSDPIAATFTEDIGATHREPPPPTFKEST